MPGIVCAIRGGPASQPTIQKSINLAKTNGQTIFFLYVINLDFLTHAGEGRTGHIADDLREMGEFILLAAQEQAREQGLCAEMVSAEGDVIEELIRLCLEVEADYVVLGRPQKDIDLNLFDEEGLQSISEQIEETTNAAVMLST
jgi:nucleotide-binding universal stress UspA family protein